MQTQKTLNKESTINLTTPELAEKLHVNHWANEKLKGCIMFLMLPALYLGSQILFNFKYPLPIYYLFALIIGSTLFFKSIRDPELALCIFIIYMPLSKMAPLSIVPLVNGTNLLIGLLILAWIAQASRDRAPLFNRYPMTRLMGLYGFYSSISFLTLIINFGFASFIDNILDVKSWLDHFIVFFIFINIIKDTGQARRIVVYLLIALLIVSIYGFDEMLERAGRSSIEKSRVRGVQDQSNEFGAYLVHASVALVGTLGLYWTNFRSWVLFPYLFVLLKLIISSYSRGAMLGFGIGIIIAIFSRGIHYLLAAILAGAIIFYQFPELLPESVIARFNQTTVADPGVTEAQLDKSSQSRLLLWDAAKRITLDNPIFGVGFKGFAMIKGDYTEEGVVESDTHNMYLFICSQMGIPALVLLVLIFMKMFWLSRKVFYGHPSKSARAIALGGIALVPGVAAINMFGTRMLDISTINVLWIYMAVVIKFYCEMKDVYGEEKPPKKPVLP